MARPDFESSESQMVHNLLTGWTRKILPPKGYQPPVVRNDSAIDQPMNLSQQLSQPLSHEEEDEIYDAIQEALRADREGVVASNRGDHFYRGPHQLKKPVTRDDPTPAERFRPYRPTKQS